MSDSGVEQAVEELTERQRLFVDEYLIDLNATKAAIRAGYSPLAARQQGSTLLSNPYISAAIQVAQSARSRRTGITADRVIREIACIAFSDISEVADVAGGEVVIHDLDSLPRRVRRAVESVASKPSEHGVSRTVKMHPKLVALKMLADHLGLSADTVSKVELTGKDGGPVETEARVQYVITVPPEEQE